MARPPALVGAKRIEAHKLLAKGLSAREVAKRLKVGSKTIDRMVLDGRKKALDTKKKPRASKADTSPSGIEDPIESEFDADKILAEDLRFRLALRDGLKSDFDASEEPRERTLIAKELGACLDGLRKVVEPTTKGDGDLGDDEAGLFDSYMLQAVNKARAIEHAESRVSLEAESPGEVGDRAGSGGSN